MRAAVNPSFRPLVLAVLAVAVVGVSGCKTFGKGNPDYALSPETRPLEVPPDLTLPSTAGAMRLPPAATGQLISQAATGTASATSFHVVGSRDEVFTRLGTALAAVDGLNIASRAPLLGTYDVSYEGSNFLVRVAAVETGTFVSAVDPRGIPATGAAAAKLIAEIRPGLAK